MFEYFFFIIKSFWEFRYVIVYFLFILTNSMGLFKNIIRLIRLLVV